MSMDPSVAALVWAGVFPLLCGWLAWLAREKRAALALILAGLPLLAGNQWRLWVTASAGESGLQQGSDAGCADFAHEALEAETLLLL